MQKMVEEMVWCGDWCGLERKAGDDSRGGVRSRLTSERKGSDSRRRRKGCVEEAAEKK